MHFLLPGAMVPPGRDQVASDVLAVGGRTMITRRNALSGLVGLCLLSSPAAG